MKIDLIAIDKMTPPCLRDLGYLRDSIAGLEQLLLLNLRSVVGVKPVISLGRQIARASNQLRSMINDNFNMRLRAWVFTDGARIRRAQSIIGEANIQRSKLRHDVVLYLALIIQGGIKNSKEILEVGDEPPKPHKQNIIPDFKPYEWKLFTLPKIERVTAPKPTRSNCDFQFDFSMPSLLGACTQARKPRGLDPAVFWPHELESGYDVPTKYLHQDNTKDDKRNKVASYPSPKPEQVLSSRTEKARLTKPP